MLVITVGMWQPESGKSVADAAESRAETATASMTPTSIPNIGSLMVAAGHNYSCALLTDGTLRCWGANDAGQLGLGTKNYYGDDANEVGAGLPTVNIGQTVKYITAGEHNTTCAIRADDATVCWGNGYGYLLGTGAWTNTIGDQSGEMGSALTPVDFGSSYAVTLSEGDNHICALLASAAVKCWGQNDYGQLGINGTANYGASAELGANWTAINLNGRTAVAVSAGAFHTCAILDTGAVTCWGLNDKGQLGYGDTTNRTSADLGSALTTVNLGTGRTATAIAAGGAFTCAILDNGTLKCWGYNESAQLGLGDKIDRYYEPTRLSAISLGTGRTVTAAAVVEVIKPPKINAPLMVPVAFSVPGVA
jgi:alpha-tubulin suppressor-like RCC1 family protein